MKTISTFSIFVSTEDGTFWGPFNTIAAAENYAKTMLPYGTYNIELRQPGIEPQTAYKVEITEYQAKRFI